MYQSEYSKYESVYNDYAIFLKKTIILCKSSGEIEPIFDLLLDMTSDKSIKNQKSYFYRDYFTSKIAWSIPDKDTIMKVSDFFYDKGTILEVGAGLGLWSAIFQAMGLDVIVTDEFSSDGLEIVSPEQCFTEVKRLSAIDAIKKYSHANILFMSWIPRDIKWCSDAIDIYKGKYIILIGDEELSAEATFYHKLSENWNYIDIEVFELRQWLGIYDCIQIYQRKPLYVNEI